MLTVWLRSSRLRASVEPTRPQPMITTCTIANATGESGAGARSAARALASPRGRRRCLQADPARAASSAAPSWARPAPQADRAARSSPATRSRRWPTRRTRSSSCCPSPGASAYAVSWKIGVAVAIVMLTVVASYRQNVHAYPSGGGDYEVAKVNLGENAGVTVASALLVDYVLTVAVSVSSGVQNAASAIPFMRATRRRVAVRPGGRARRDEPARGPRVGGVLRHPDLRLHDRRASAWRCTALIRALAGRPARRREREPHDRAGPRRTAATSARSR